MPKKKQTSAEKKADLFTAYKQISNNQPVKRPGRADGSIGTKPTVLVRLLSEHDVSKGCMIYLKKRGIVCDRNNVGFGDIHGRGVSYRFGIKDAGDIIACLPDGKHLEIECKKGKGGSLSSGQQKRRDKIRANKGIYIVTHGVEELHHQLTVMGY